MYHYYVDTRMDQIIDKVINYIQLITKFKLEVL